jgi:organic radical activating enzyme
MPKRLNEPRTFLRIFPIHFCNYACEYCTVYTRLNTELKWKEFDLLDGDSWATALNRLGPMYKYLVVSGGEPTLHPDFVQIFNDYEHRNAVVYSNCSQKAVDKFVQLNEPIMIYASYHVKEERKRSEEPFLSWAKRLQKLQDAGHNLQTPHVPDDGDAEIARLPDWMLATRVEGSVGTLDGGFYSPYVDSTRVFSEELKTVMCTTDQFVIAQDGSVWNCQAKMWSKRGEPLGYIWDLEPDELPDEILCHEFGACHTCSQDKMARNLTENEQEDYASKNKAAAASGSDCIAPSRQAI